MFVILLNYIRPLNEVDAFVSEHWAFLAAQVAAGVFVISGAKVPRTGGVILAKGVSRAALEIVVTQDPFYREKLAEYEIVEFTPRFLPDWAL